MDRWRALCEHDSHPRLEPSPGPHWANRKPPRCAAESRRRRGRPRRLSSGITGSLVRMARLHPTRESKQVTARLEKEFDCVPVVLPSTLARPYYAGFSNGTLWPLFPSSSRYGRSSASDGEAYRDANARFADAIVRALRPTDQLWIHDYHLLLLPRLIRERVPEARVGFFLHIPFPPYDVFRLLPWHRDILQGMLGADLIGFHTYDYARAFLGSVLRDLGLDNRIGTIVAGHRRARGAHQQPIQHDCMVADPICVPPTRLRRARRPLSRERCGDRHAASRWDEPHREGVRRREAGAARRPDPQRDGRRIEGDARGPHREPERRGGCRERDPSGAHDAGGGAGLAHSCDAGAAPALRRAHIGDAVPRAPRRCRPLVRGSQFEEALGRASEGDPPSVPQGDSTAPALRL